MAPRILYSLIALTKGKLKILDVVFVAITK